MQQLRHSHYPETISSKQHEPKTKHTTNILQKIQEGRSHLGIKCLNWQKVKEQQDRKLHKLEY